jgi:DNA-binding transcriptional MocR family regulator
MNETLINEGMELLQYGDPLGYEPLRRYIASRMRQHGISVSAPEVMITKGAQNAFELLIRLLTKPGAAVLVEAPTYSRAIDLFRLSGLQIMEVPMNKGGMDLDALEGLLSQASPDLIYTIPNFHNPTGTTTSQGHRERLFRLCLKHQVPLVEDGFEEELKYFGKAVLPIKSMDSQGVVIYVGTFSKILFPGLRIGWIAADQECIQRLAPLQKASLVAGNLLDQAALHRFCALGHYDRHIKRMHRVYRRRMLVALKAMQAHLDPKKVEWTKPQGGYTTWLRLKGLPLSEDEVLDHLFQCKVALLPGSTHYYGPTQGLCFRLSIAILDEAAIEQGIQRLGQGISQLYQSARGKKG